MLLNVVRLPAVVYDQGAFEVLLTLSCECLSTWFTGCITSGKMRGHWCWACWAIQSTSGSHCCHHRTCCLVPCIAGSLVGTVPALLERFCSCCGEGHRVVQVVVVVGWVVGGGARGRRRRRGGGWERVCCRQWSSWV